MFCKRPVPVSVPHRHSSPSQLKHPKSYAHSHYSSRGWGTPSRTPEILSIIHTPSHSLFLNAQILNPFSWCEIKLYSSSTWTFKSSSCMFFHLAAFFSCHCPYLRPWCHHFMQFPKPSLPNPPSESPASIDPQVFLCTLSYQCWCLCLASCSSTAHPLKTVFVFLIEPCAVRWATLCTLQQIFTKQILSLDPVQAGISVLIC